ncbi:MAG: efflux RND transporter periplasmic adaptor subunit [Myxococcota bacterium]
MARSQLAGSRRLVQFSAVIVWLAASGAGCGEAPQVEPEVARPIKILELGGPGVGSVREFPGQVSAAQHVELAFEASGQLIEFPVREAQEVTKGQLLAKLDPRDFAARRDSENAKLALARSEFERARALFKADVASEQELDRAQHAYDVAKANAKQAIKSFEDDAVLKAPFSGVIAKTLVENFQNVRAKEPVLILQDASSLELVIAIPEADFATMVPGLSLEERTARSRPEVMISAHPGRRFPARLKEFSTTADPTTRTYEAVVTFDRPEDITVSPGMTARLIFHVSASIRDVGLSIPASAALADERGDAYVWKVDPATMRVSRGPVSLGAMAGDAVIVRDGLKSGDWVALTGVHHLREGMEVSRLQQ